MTDFCGICGASWSCAHAPPLHERVPGRYVDPDGQTYRDEHGPHAADGTPLWVEGRYVSLEDFDANFQPVGTGRPQVVSVFLLVGIVVQPVDAIATAAHALGAAVGQGMMTGLMNGFAGVLTALQQFKEQQEQRAIAAAACAVGQPAPSGRSRCRPVRPRRTWQPIPRVLRCRPPVALIAVPAVARAPPVGRPFVVPWG